MILSTCELLRQWGAAYNRARDVRDVYHEGWVTHDDLLTLAALYELAMIVEFDTAQELRARGWYRTPDNATGWTR